MDSKPAGPVTCDLCGGPLGQPHTFYIQSHRGSVEQKGLTTQQHRSVSRVFTHTCCRRCFVKIRSLEMALIVVGVLAVALWVVGGLGMAMEIDLLEPLVLAACPSVVVFFAAFFLSAGLRRRMFRRSNLADVEWALEPTLGAHGEIANHVLAKGKRTILLATWNRVKVEPVPLDPEGIRGRRKADFFDARRG